MPTNLPKPPPLGREALEGLSGPTQAYLTRVSEWSRELQARLEREIEGIVRERQQPQFPVEIPVLNWAEITGTRFRAGGTPAIVYIPDAPGGPAIGFRDGSDWRAVYPDV
jgi:hypothetical protein